MFQHIPCTVKEPVKIQKSAKQDMAALTSELIEGMCVRWKHTNPEACKILGKVAEWDEVTTDLRLNLLGWISLRTDAEIVSEAMELLDALETVAATSSVTEMGEEVMIDVVELCTVLLRTMNEEKVKDNDDKGDEVEEVIEEIDIPGGLENKIDKLRMKWALGRQRI